MTRAGGIGFTAAGVLAIVLVTPVIAPRAASLPEATQAIRFDAGYYYDTGLPVDVLAERLVSHWQQQGVNLIYFYAYSFAYGARYPTRYQHNTEEDFGRLNLLGHIVAQAHRRNMKVIAWIYILRHRGAWEAHPAWRSLTASGRPYQAGFDRYFLSPHHPEAVQWWLGFVEDLLAAAPEIDGVDLAEPIVNWWGREADFSPAARTAFGRLHPGARPGDEAWLRFRADALSEVVAATAEVVKRWGKDLHITTTLTARPDGTLLGPAEQRAQTGFDLDRILNSPWRPDVLNAELIFQQWSSAHRAPGVFTPEWTGRAARAAAAQVGGRARLVAHVELSSFAGRSPTLPEFERTLSGLRQEGFAAIDIYGAHLMDASGAWEVVRTAFLSRRARPAAPPLLSPPTEDR